MGCFGSIVGVIGGYIAVATLTQSVGWGILGAVVGAFIGYAGGEGYAAEQKSERRNGSVEVVAILAGVAIGSLKRE